MQSDSDVLEEHTSGFKGAVDEVGDKLGFHPVSPRCNMFGKMDCFSFYLIDIHGRMEHVKTSCDLFSMILFGTFIILKNRRFLSVFSPIFTVFKGFYIHISTLFRSAKSYRDFLRKLKKLGNLNRCTVCE